MEIKENQSLLNFNTFHVDVHASFLIRINNENEIVESFEFAKAKNLNYMILGGGSNVLFLHDFDGVIFQPVNKGIEIVDENRDEVIIQIQAGESWDDVVRFSIDNNFFGIENLSAIPGSAGAAPIQNIGAYGVEVKDSLISVLGMKISSAKKLILTNQDCEFGYRNSIFKRELKNDFLITSIRLKLSKIPKVNLSYSNLSEYFSSKKMSEISSKEISAVIRKIRESKLPNPEMLGNAGSFFKNPVVSKLKYDELESQFDSIPSFIINENEVKIPAGWLIEKCGFKGKRIGNVGTYEKQSLIIVNYSNATGKEIKSFAEKIRSEVKMKFGINLEYEVNII